MTLARHVILSVVTIALWTANAEAATPVPSPLGVVADDSPETFGGGAIIPIALAVDTAGNAVLEPNETAVLAPTWANLFINPTALTGTASNFTGPAGPVYAIPDATANYGTLPPFGQGSCSATGDCYSVRATAASRPLTHWDSTIFEAVAGGFGSKTWRLHIGAS